MGMLEKKRDMIPSILSDFFDTDFFRPSELFREPFLSRIPAANLREKEDRFELELAAPGMEREDFNIDLTNNRLTISAEKKSEKREEKEDYMRREFSYSSFSRSFILPDEVNAEKIDAIYKDGMLKIDLPKKEEAKRKPGRSIQVRGS